jgi:hypothetical protein
MTLLLALMRARDHSNDTIHRRFTRSWLGVVENAPDIGAAGGDNQGEFVMKLSSLALGLALAMAAVMPAAAQRGPGPGNWELLGQERVGIGSDRDVINLGRGEDYFRGRSFRRLRFVADGGDVRMRAIRLHYLNGYSEDFQFEQNLRPGQEIDIDLRGERSYLRQIEMFYKGKFGISIGGGGLRVNQPVIKVLGENVRSGPPPIAAPGYRPKPGWQLLGQQAVGFGVDRDVIRINPFDDWRNRGYDRLHFVAENNDLHLISVRVVYQNGFGENVRVDRLIRAGDDLALDLPGRRSYLREIEMVYRNRPGFPGRATISVYGETSRRR